MCEFRVEDPQPVLQIRKESGYGELGFGRPNIYIGKYARTIKGTRTLRPLDEPLLVICQHTIVESATMMVPGRSFLGMSHGATS